MKLWEIGAGGRFTIPSLKFKGKVEVVSEGCVRVRYDHMPYTPLTIDRETEVERENES